MEPDQRPAETSDDYQKPPFMTSDHQQQQQQNTAHTLIVRSYECNFCKRGFTNAQALGGHMNIHRKDKNKAKHSPITTTTPNTHAEPPNPFSISHQDEKKPPPLFEHSDTVVPINIHQSAGNPPILQEDVVDLELRLGHNVEPPSESSSEKSTITTRKFF